MSQRESKGLRRSVAIERINVEDTRYQFRVSTTVKDLEQSLQAHGQKMPVVLQLLDDERYRIIDGFRRCKAAKNIALSTMHADVYELSEAEAVTMAITLNAVRKSFSAMDKANAIYEAGKRGVGTKELGEAMAMSEKQLHRYRVLLTYPKPIQDAVDAGRITMAHALVLARCPEEEISAAIAEVAAKRLSAAELKVLLKRKCAPGPTREAGRRPERYFHKDDKTIRIYPKSVQLCDHEKLRRLLASLEQQVDVVERALESNSRFNEKAAES